jgi:hypothetical protein
MLTIKDAIKKWWHSGEVTIREDRTSFHTPRIEIQVFRWNLPNPLVFSKSLWLDGLSDLIFDIRDYGAQALDPELPNWAVVEIEEGLNEIARKRIRAVLDRPVPFRGVIPND